MQNDKGMEDAMKSEGEFLIEKELTPIKSKKLVAVDSGEMDEELVSLRKELEKVNKKRREQKMKEKKYKIRKEIEIRKKELKKKAEKEKGDDKVNQSVIVSKTNLISQKTVV